MSDIQPLWLLPCRWSIYKASGESTYVVFTIQVPLAQRRIVNIDRSIQFPPLLTGISTIFSLSIPENALVPTIPKRGVYCILKVTFLVLFSHAINPPDIISRSQCRIFVCLSGSTVGVLKSRIHTLVVLNDPVLESLPRLLVVPWRLCLKLSFRLVSWLFDTLARRRSSRRAPRCRW
jgi:hypothetical protein